MSNNIYQVAKMIQRQGRAEELPYQLDSGEFGFSTDTLELFIGVGDNPKFASRTEYPYGNLKILTELSEPLDIQKYRYEGNTPIKAMFPIIFKGYTGTATLESGSSVSINDIEITFDNETGLEGIVKKINDKAIPYTNAYSMEGYLVIVSTDNILKVANGEIGSFIQTTGLTNDISIDELSAAAEDLIETTIQKVLDEYLTIKHFNVKGDGETDDTNNINKALLGTYCVVDAPIYLRTIYFPAGEYIISGQLNIPSNARLLGEGKGRTVIKATGDFPVMIGWLDDQKKPSDSDEFGEDNINPKNITIEGFTFDGSDIVNTIVEMYKGSDITFRNCEFKNCINSIINFNSDDSNTEDLHITFDYCDFENGGIGLDTDLAYAKHLSVMNCHFKDIDEQAIIIGENSLRALLHNNCFINCSNLSDEIVLIKGEYASLLHSQFDESVVEFNTTPLPYTDETEKTLYTDTLDPHTATEDMVYKFHYPQPTWGYVENLRNQRGEYILKPVVDSTDNEIINWVLLKIGTETNKTIELYSSDKFSDFKLGGGEYANLIIGDCSDKFDTWLNSHDYEENDYVEYNNHLYRCKVAHTSTSSTELSNDEIWEHINDLNELMIVLGKNLNLNNHYITNNEDRDITFKPKGDAVVVVDDDNYIQKIDQVPNALATVEYIKNNIAAKSLTYYISMDNFTPSEDWNQFDLATLLADSYSDNVYIKNISVSVENIFRKYNFEDMIEWQPEMVCYKGMAVKHNGAYYVSKETHANQVWVNAQWEEIDINGYNPDSIRIYAIQNGVEEDLAPAGVIKLYTAEDNFPEETIYTADSVKGNTFYYQYSRHTNVSNYTIRAEITDENGNLATNFQPSGKLFIIVDLIIV